MTDTSRQPEVLEIVDESAEAAVRWYSVAKGFGFLHHPQYEDDIFVHHSALVDPDNLIPGDAVRFRLVRTDRGLQAQKVEVVVAAEPVDPRPRRRPS
jgi:cold shock CspA family protein